MRLNLLNELVSNNLWLGVPFSIFFPLQSLKLQIRRKPTTGKLSHHYAGLSFLAPRVAKWRYTRGTRLLADSFSKGEQRNGGEKVRSTEEEEEDYDIPDEIEDVLEILFRGTVS